MERFNKKLLLIIMLLGLFLLTGCNKFHFGTFNASEEDKTSTEVTITPDEGKQDTLTSTGQGEDTKSNKENQENTPTPSTIQPVANIDLPIYIVNVDTGDIETKTAPYPRIVNLHQN